MKIVIDTANNGYAVTTYPDEGLSNTSVFQQLDNTKRAHIQEMFYHILNEIGESGSRYDSARVSISIEPGDKHEGDKNE